MMQPLKTINRLNLPDLSGNSVLNLGGEGGGAVDLKEVHAKKYGFKGGAGGEGGGHQKNSFKFCSDGICGVWGCTFKSKYLSRIDKLFARCYKLGYCTVQYLGHSP